jgi:hypothetical protein
MNLNLWELCVALSEFTRKQVETRLKAFCERRVPARVRDEIRLGWKFRGNNVTLFESRPSFPDRATWVDIPVAQFRFDEKGKTWELYQADRNGRWHWYTNAVATPDFNALLAEVDEDPTGIFWG